MKRVAVVGAGIVGVTTAWYLREHGFDVTVYERRAGAALGTSAGNAGIIAPGYVTPWAAPGMPRKLASFLLAPESPVIFRPFASEPSKVNRSEANTAVPAFTNSSIRAFTAASRSL